MLHHRDEYEGLGNTTMENKDMDYSIVDMVLNKKFRIRWDRIAGGIGVGLIIAGMLSWGIFAS